MKWVALVGCHAQMITAGCLAGVSDSVAQKLSGYQKIEKRRLLLKMVRTLPCIWFLVHTDAVTGATASFLVHSLGFGRIEHLVISE